MLGFLLWISAPCETCFWEEEIDGYDGLLLLFDTIGYSISIAELLLLLLLLLLLFWFESRPTAWVSTAYLEGAGCTYGWLTPCPISLSLCPCIEGWVLPWLFVLLWWMTALLFWLLGMGWIDEAVEVAELGLFGYLFSEWVLIVLTWVDGWVV